MEPLEYTQLIALIREELGYTRGVQPEVVQIYDDPDMLHLVFMSRAEKSQCIGPGGRIIAELSKRCEKRVSVHSSEELCIRKNRLNQTLSRIEEISTDAETQREFLSVLRDAVVQEKLYPALEPKDTTRSVGAISITVAYSGGVDSTASLLYLKKWNIKPIAITADPGPRFLPPKHKEKMEEVCSELGIDHKFVDASHQIQETIIGAEEGRFHPCGSCHSVLIDTVYREALDGSHNIIVTGELLPQGRQSIILDENHLLTIHLPATLSFTKFRTRKLCTDSDLPVIDGKFGCGFLSKIHGSIPGMIYPSIDRVLREVDAGILTTGEAQGYIRDIMKPLNRSRMNRDD